MRVSGVPQVLLSNWLSVAHLTLSLSRACPRCSLITCIFGARGVHSPQRHLSSYSRLGPVGLWYLLQRLPQRVGLAIAERSPTLDRPANDIDPPRQMPPDGPCLVVLWLQRRPPSGVQPSLLGRVSPGRRITIYQRRNGAVTHPRPLRNL